MASHKPRPAARPRAPQTKAAKSAEAQRLRADIDRGATGDKIPYADPAAAPLGTDDEAAGVPPGPAPVTPSVAEPAPDIPPGHAKGWEHPGRTTLAVAFASAVGVILLALLLWAALGG